MHAAYVHSLEDDSIVEDAGDHRVVAVRRVDFAHDLIWILDIQRSRRIVVFAAERRHVPVPRTGVFERPGVHGRELSAPDARLFIEFIQNACICNVAAVDDCVHAGIAEKAQCLAICFRAVE